MRLSIAFLITVAGAAGAVVFPAAAQDQKELIELGDYLVNGPVACGNCHTPRAADMSFLPGMDLAGGFKIVEPIFEVYTANITPDAETGIGNVCFGLGPRM